MVLYCASPQSRLFRSDYLQIALTSHRVLKTLQRELAMYVYHNLDRPLTSYFLDKDIHPVFKGAHGTACIIDSST